MRKIGQYIQERRWKFKKGMQKEFILQVKKKSGKNWRELANEVDISEHSLKWDIFHEKTTLPESIGKKFLTHYLSERRKIIEKEWIVTVLDKNWWQKKAGEKVLRSIKVPPYSENLAEFIGAVIGDGHINKKGVRITGNSFEVSHHRYIQKLIRDLFNLDAKVFTPRNVPSISILNIYSKELVSFLGKMNLKKGNKIKNKTKIPSWIFHDEIFIHGALRGLLDTDGGVYSKQKEYSRAFIEFQNHCEVTRKHIIKLIRKAGFTYSKSSINIRIQNQEEVKRFFETVGSSNPKNIIRYQEFIRTGSIPLKEKLNQKVLEYRGVQPFKMRL